MSCEARAQAVRIKTRQNNRNSNLHIVLLLVWARTIQPDPPCIHICIHPHTHKHTPVCAQHSSTHTFIDSEASLRAGLYVCRRRRRRYGNDLRARVSSTQKCGTRENSRLFWWWVTAVYRLQSIWYDTSISATKCMMPARQSIVFYLWQRQPRVAVVTVELSSYLYDLFKTMV